jgi:hypothetical protein
MWTARVLLAVLAVMCALAFFAPEPTRALGLAGLSQYTTNPFTPYIGIVSAIGVAWLFVPALTTSRGLRIFWMVYGIVGMGVVIAISAGGGVLLALAAGSAGRHGKYQKDETQVPAAGGA